MDVIAMEERIARQRIESGEWTEEEGHRSVLDAEKDLRFYNGRIEWRRKWMQKSY